MNIGYKFIFGILSVLIVPFFFHTSVAHGAIDLIQENDAVITDTGDPGVTNNTRIYQKFTDWNATTTISYVEFEVRLSTSSPITNPGSLNIEITSDPDGTCYDAEGGSQSEVLYRDTGSGITSVFLGSSTSASSTSGTFHSYRISSNFFNATLGAPLTISPTSSDICFGVFRNASAQNTVLDSFGDSSNVATDSEIYCQEDTTGASVSCGNGMLEMYYRIGAVSLENFIEWEIPLDHADIVSHPFTTRAIYSTSTYATGTIITFTFLLNRGDSLVDQRTIAYQETAITNTSGIATSSFSLANGNYRGIVTMGAYSDTIGNIDILNNANPDLPTGFLYADNDNFEFGVPGIDNVVPANFASSSFASCSTGTLFLTGEELLCVGKKFGTWLFWPTEGSTEYLKSQFTEYDDVFPFSVVFSSLSTVSSSITTQRATGTVPGPIYIMPSNATMTMVTKDTMQTRFGATLKNQIFTFQELFFWLCLWIYVFAKLFRII